MVGLCVEIREEGCRWQSDGSRRPLQVKWPWGVPPGSFHCPVRGSRPPIRITTVAAMSDPVRPLGRPLQLRHLTLRNRVVFGAHTTNMSELGLPAAQHLGYYRERARGGAAMVVVEPVPVHRTAVLTRGNFRHSDDAVIPGFRAITDAVHAEGAVVMQQLYHVGQHGDFDNSYQPAWSPSGLPSYHDNDGSHAMTDAEIVEIVDAFVAAAVRAQRCGFDGVEIFAAYHSLVDQFWLPWSNRRKIGRAHV